MLTQEPVTLAQGLPAPRRPPPWRAWTARAWRALRSMTFAIVMLVCDVLIVAAGQFMPGDAGIRQVYHTWWFFGFVCLLLLSVLTCTTRRARGMVRVTLRPALVHPAAFYTSTGRDPAATAIAASPDQANNVLRAVLAARRYRVTAETRDGVTYYHADRHHLFRFGTLLSHFGIVFLVAMIMWGALAGMTINNVILEPGQSYRVGHGTGLTVHVDSFDVLFYPNGEPRAFPDRLTVTHDGPRPRPASGTIDVNTPLTVDGVTFSQSTYAAAARPVLLQNGKVQPVYLMGQTDPAGRPTSATRMQFDLLGDGLYSQALAVAPNQHLALLVQFHDPVPDESAPYPTLFVQLLRLDAKGNPVPVASRDLEVRPATIPGLSAGGRPVQVATWRYKDLAFAFVVNRVTGLSVNANPAIPFIYASFVIILLGLFGVLYFPYVRLWAMVRPPAAGSGDGATEVLLRGRGEKNRVAFARAFTALGDDLRGRLRA